MIDFNVSNAKIFTLNERFSIEQSLVLTNGKIIAIISDKKIPAYSITTIELIDSD